MTKTKEELKEYQKKWNRENKDKRRLYKKKYLAKRKEIGKNKKLTKEKAILYRTKYRAKKKNLEFSIKAKDLILCKKCPCCGITLIYFNSGKVKPATASIDRINPLKGYIPGNVAIICLRCNTLKNNASIQEIFNILKYMQSYLPSV